MAQGSTYGWGPDFWPAFQDVEIPTNVLKPRYAVGRCMGRQGEVNVQRIAQNVVNNVAPKAIAVKRQAAEEESTWLPWVIVGLAVVALTRGR